MRKAAMLHQLSGASRVDHAYIGLHKNIGRARIAVGRQARRIEEQIERRPGINFADSGTLGISLWVTAMLCGDDIRTPLAPRHLPGCRKSCLSTSRSAKLLPGSMSRWPVGQWEGGALRLRS